jgi:hypothetical protein
MYMNSVSNPTVLIEIGAEGGSIKILARTGSAETTEYSVQLRDQTLTFLSKDEGDNVIRRDSAWSTRWEDVIVSLGRWPWPMLVPMYVDADYAARVLAAVSEYRGRDGQQARTSAIGRWQEACRESAGKQRGVEFDGA